MSELYDSIRLTRSAATFTRALGIDAPDGADAPCDIVLDKLFAELGEGGADRVFIYNPVALGDVYARQRARIIPARVFL